MSEELNNASKATFDYATIRALVTQHLPPGSKITKDATFMTGDYLHMLVEEAILRAAKEAADEVLQEYNSEDTRVSNRATVEPRHLQKILPKLLLDF